MRIISNEELLLISGGDGEEFDEFDEFGSDVEDSYYGWFDSPDGSKRKKIPRGGGSPQKGGDASNPILDKIKEEAADRLSELIVDKGSEWLGKGLEALADFGKEMLDIASKQPPVNPGQRSGRE
ncbi:hypothetical protein RF679_13770 [Undibacterium cyanobacteriorum]|uniref:Uncharacterized protein n=1 Tax=Undibacterium cyanobacteriorum TaxID=3073561 RepID=A0ABY9RFT0_9BURK|nr:hypothetical protein [Undibacterium sp. 20NA77.5]WMW79714.1 hypothetical protein RF679_13770 [Undibacterium sp. 20NA77.5]